MPLFQETRTCCDLPRPYPNFVEVLQYFDILTRNPHQTEPNLDDFALPIGTPTSR